MLGNLRLKWHWEKVKYHTAQISSLLETRVQYDLNQRKGMVLATNFEIVSNATRVLSALRKAEEIGVRADHQFDVQEIRTWLTSYVDLPAIPRSELETTPQSEINRLYRRFELDQGRSDGELLGKEEPEAPEPSRRSRSEGLSSTQQARLDANRRQDAARRLSALSWQYDIPGDVIKRKFRSYSATLQMSDQDSNWNDDINDHARQIGALSEDEIEAAKSDLLAAIVNRVKLALVMEGWIERGVEGGSGVYGTPDLVPPVEIPDPFPDRISVPDRPRVLTVSLESADSENQYRGLRNVAIRGAATYLCHQLEQQLEAIVDSQVLEDCARTMVIEGVEDGKAPTEDTRGFLIAGQQKLLHDWNDWQEREKDPRAFFERFYSSGN